MREMRRSDRMITDREEIVDVLDSCKVFRGKGKLGTLMIFPSIFKGEHVKYEKHVDIFNAKEVEVEFDRPTPLQIDGETILGVTSYKVKAWSLDQK